MERPLIETKLLTAIKKLNDHKDAYNAYLEADETVAMMSPEEAQQNKKYLVYMYKWIISQKVWSNEEIERLGSDLKKIIV